MSIEFALDPGQLLLLGLIATAIIQGIKWIGQLKGNPLAAKWVRLIVFIVSLGMGYIWIQPAIPKPVEPMEFLLALIAGLSAVGGAAKVIYDVLLERVLKGLDLIFQFRGFKFEP